MEFFELKSFYIITDIKEHEYYKPQLLDCIGRMPDANIDDGIEVVSKTDWNLSVQYRKEYLEIFTRMIDPYLKEMGTKLKCKKGNVSNAWYQVYEEGDKHDWHTHPKANYTNVYYLSLPNQLIKTQLYDVVGECIVEDIEVKEGQILTFPASVLHRSPVNKIYQPKKFWSFKNTVEKKVVISFNSDFE